MGRLMLIHNAEVLNSKKIKVIVKLLAEQWGFTENLESGFLQKENDLFLVTRDIDKIDLQQINVNSLGLYFGELRNDELRLSIEGSQIIGKKASKNVIILDNLQLKSWLVGDAIDLPSDIDCNTPVFAIIRNNDDFFGCGRVKNRILLNFVPKSRRMALRL
jgi:NOL1/NOP2/fmu family ribosome biogenesis protein